MTGTLIDAAVCLLLVSAAAVVVTTADRHAVDDAPGRAGETAETLATVTDTVRTDRARHGTLAELLAAAAVGDAAGDAPLATAVARTVRAVVGRRVRVTARWRPYPGAPVGGNATVGPSPPPGRATDAARLVVPVGPPADDAPSTTRGILARLLPRDPPTSNRLRAVAAAYGVESRSSRPRISRVRRAVAERTDRDLAGSTGAVRVGRVRIVVRTWSA